MEMNDLTIDHVVEMDGGMYRCVAENSVGMKKSRRAEMTIEIGMACFDYILQDIKNLSQG